MIYEFNDVIGKWTMVSGASIDANTNRVIIAVNSLSAQYALIGKLAVTKQPGSGSSNQQGGGTATYNVDKNPSAYSYEYVGQSANVTMRTNETVTLVLKIKNTGTATWYQDGTNPLALGTARNLDRASKLYSDSWIAKNRAARMMETSVKTGGIATFAFDITAPSKAGNFKEYFRPVIQDITWMKDIGIYWQVNVIRGKARSAYSAQYVTQSPYVQLDSQGNTTLWVEYKNTGTAAWIKNSKKSIRLGTSNPLDRESAFEDIEWISENRSAVLDQDIVLPGEIGRFTFKVKAGKNKGTFKEYFRPVIDGLKWLEDAGLYWDITVK